MSLKLASNHDELRTQFLDLRTPQDVAKLLDVPYSSLVYYFYKKLPAEQYSTFHIPKKRGGTREILAPGRDLKIIQQKLNQVLSQVYQPKVPVHGFINRRNIVTNAENHAHQRYVLNVDLKDFFPSINFGRVRGMFMAKPYNLSANVATVLAQICCFSNQLPQGAPTSPIVSNMICSRLDSQLFRLAKGYQCIYTRYADDITISGHMQKFPPGLAVSPLPPDPLELGKELTEIIKNNGFAINPKKARLQIKYHRQEVTGLTTNNSPNVKRTFVKQVRAMLHAWETYGLAAASREYLEKYDRKHRLPKKAAPQFKKVVKGKIDYLKMVRGPDDAIFNKLRNRFLMLAPEYGPPTQLIAHRTSTVQVITEGKTDWKHLKAALLYLQGAGRFTDLSIKFKEYDDGLQMGDDRLLDRCESMSIFPQKEITVCIFDHDNQKIVDKVNAPDGDYKVWGNNVFSFAIPIPSHREAPQGKPNVCIELYYRDSDLQREDSEGRRLFLRNEFNESGRLLANPLIYWLGMKKDDPRPIIDTGVVGENDKKIALSKNAFADSVYEGRFQSLDFSEFGKIFALITRIASENRPPE